MARCLDGMMRMGELEKLEKAVALGFELIGPTFRDTLAYVQLQREIKELQSSKESVKID